VILIDALDEATEKTGKNELASFIAAEFEKTPEWLRLIITSRPEPELTHSLQALTPYVLDASSEENEQDLREYLTRELRAFNGGKRVSLRVVETVIAKTEGLFLYAEWIRKELQQRHLSLERIEQFPQGLGGVYAQFFNRQFPDVEGFSALYRPVLEVITAARDALEVSYLASLFAWSDYAGKEIPDALGSLFPLSDGRIQAFHKSVLEWLTAEQKAGSYFISVREGHKRLVDHGWREYRSGVASMSRYSLAHLPAHLSIIPGREEDLRKLLLDFDWLQAKFEATDVDSLIKDFAFLRGDETMRLVQDALRLSAHALVRDKTELPGQLFGRLSWLDARGIQPMLHRIKSWRRKPWLRPVNRWLASPGGPLVRTLEDTGPVAQVALALEGRRALSTSHDANVRIWDLESGEGVTILPGVSARGIVWQDTLAVTPDALWAVSGSNEGVLTVWNLERGEVVRRSKCPARLLTVWIAPDGKTAISGAGDGILEVWNLETGKVLHKMTADIGDVRAVAVTPDGSRAVSGSRDGTLKLWDVRTGALLCTLADPIAWKNAVLEKRKRKEPGSFKLPVLVDALAITPDGRKAIAGGWDRTLTVWDFERKEALLKLKSHGRVKAIAVTLDGRRVVSSSGATLTVWDLESGKELRVLEGHTDEVQAVAIAPDGRRAVSGSSDRTLRVWDLESGAASPGLNEVIYALSGVSVTRHGHMALSTSLEGTIKAWDLESGIQLRVLKSTGWPRSGAHEIAISPDGRRAMFLSDYVLGLWDFERGGERRILEEHERSMDLIFSQSVIAMTADGQLAVAPSLGCTLKVWDLDSGISLHTLHGHSQSIRAVSVTKDGKRAVSASRDRTVKIWDLESGKELYSVQAEVMALTSDGRLAVAESGFDDVILQMWDIENGAVLRPFEVRTNTKRAWIHAFTTDAEGRHAVLASISASGGRPYLKVWDLRTGALLHTMEGHAEIIDTVAITPDGHWVVSGSHDQTLKVWDAEKGTLVASFSVDDKVRNCDISPDGMTVVGSTFRQVLIFALEGVGQCPERAAPSGSSSAFTCSDVKEERNALQR